MVSRIVPLWAVVLLPLAFWAPFEDAFKLPQSVLAVGLALFLAVQWSIRPRVPRNAVVIPAAVLSLGFLLSALTGGMARISDSAVFIALAVSSILLAEQVKRGGKLVSAMILAGTLSALYSIFQFAGLDLVPSPGTGAGLRPFSTMGNPDFLAAYLVAVLPMAAVRGALGGSAIRVLPAASMAVALLLTQSRGAWLGAAVGMIAAPFLLSYAGIRLKPKKGLIVAVVVSLVVVIGFFSFHGQARDRLARTFSTGHFDAAGRIFMWKAGMGMIRDRPLTGTGPGGFGRAYPEWHARGLARNPGFPWFFTENAHNDYLQIPAEAGIPAFGLLIWVWAAFVRMALKAVRSGDRTALGMFIGFISLQVDAVFNFPWYIVPTQAWFWVSLAVLAGRMKGAQIGAVNRDKSGSVSRIVLLSVPALAVCFLVLRDVQANAWLKLSGDYLAAGRHPEARASADMAINRWGVWEGKSRAFNNASLAAYGMNDFVSAENYVLRSISLAPRMPGSLSQLALARARGGKLVEAERDCRAALQLNPHQAEAWHVLGNLAFMRKDLAGARAAWEKAFAENPSIPGLKQNLEVLRRGYNGKKRAM